MKVKIDLHSPAVRLESLDEGAFFTWEWTPTTVGAPSLYQKLYSLPAAVAPTARCLIFSQDGPRFVVVDNKSLVLPLKLDSIEVSIR